MSNILTSLERKRLSNQFGPEFVAKCCRYWKINSWDGRWGTCGECHEYPVKTDLTWDDIDVQGNRRLHQ